MTTSGGLKRSKSRLTFRGSVVSGHLKKIKKNRSFLFIFYLVIKL